MSIHQEQLNNKYPENFAAKAVPIRIRMWGVEAEQVRQITIVQDM